MKRTKRCAVEMCPESIQVEDKGKGRLHANKEASKKGWYCNETDDHCPEHSYIGIEFDSIREDEVEWDRI